MIKWICPFIDFQFAKNKQFFLMGIKESQDSVSGETNTEKSPYQEMCISIMILRTDYLRFKWQLILNCTPISLHPQIPEMQKVAIWGKLGPKAPQMSSIGM